MSGQANKAWAIITFFVIVLLIDVGIAWASSSHAETMVQDFYFRLMNFTILIVILIVLMRKPIKNSLKKRVEGIKNELADLELRRTKALTELAEAETKLKNVEGRRNLIVAELEDLGKNECARIIAAAEKTAQRIKDQAQVTIEQETALAKVELRNEIAQLSAAVAEKLLKQKITIEDQARLVNEYLVKVQQEVQ